MTADESKKLICVKRRGVVGAVGAGRCRGGCRRCTGRCVGGGGEGDTDDVALHPLFITVVTCHI